MSEEKRVVVVIGTRPEAIKMLPVIQQLRASSLLRPFVISTGQHPQAVRAILGLAQLAPDVELSQSPGRTLNGLFAGVLTGIEEVARTELGVDPGAGAPTRPDDPAWALVHGDTTSAAAAALACFQLGIAVAHVESGLRTRSTRSPFPEELNRQLIGRIAAFHLAPTTANKENLILESVRSEQVFVTGNTAIDALLWASSQPPGNEEDPWPDDPSRPVVAVTAHRRENWGEGLTNVAQAVVRLARAHPEVTFVAPLHPNPAVRDHLTRTMAGIANIRMTEPMPYVQFARLLGRAAFVISDSGGVQEEAPGLGTPVLVTRATTERTEGLEAGTLTLVGTDPDRIVAAASALLDDPAQDRRVTSAINPYGDGHAAERIVRALEHLSFSTPTPPRFGAGFTREAVFEALGTPVPAAHNAPHDPSLVSLASREAKSWAS